MMMLILCCNVFVSLFSMSGFRSLKEYIFQETPFSGCFQMRPMKTISRNLNYAQCLNIARMEMAWCMAPMEYIPQRKCIKVPIEYAPMEKSWLY